MIKRYSHIPLRNVKKEGVTLIQLDYTNKVVKDGKYNDFPQYLTEIIEKSPISSACLKRIADFVTGRGLHEDLQEVVIDSKGTTLWELHKAVVLDYVYFSRLAIRVNANRGGKATELYHTPAEWVRFSMNKDINDPNYHFAKVNPYIKTSQEAWNSEQVAVYKLYENTNKRDVQREIAELGENYGGHLFYHNDTRPNARIYSRPEWFSAEHAIITDGRIWSFHDRNTANNFFLGGILSILADPDAPIGDTDENDNTYTRTFRKEFEKQMHEKFAGVEQAGGIMVFYKVNENDPDPTMVTPTVNTFDSTFTSLLNDTINTLCAAFGVPKILLPQEISGKLGASTEMRNAILFMNETTKAQRETLEGCYRKLLEGMGIAIPEGDIIQPLQDFTDLPDAIFQALSPAQKSTYIQEAFGIEPDEGGIEEMEAEAEEETIEEVIFNKKINGNGNHIVNN